MGQTELVNQLFTSAPVTVFKWLFTLGLGMYAFFALVVIRQVKVMTDSVESGANGIVKWFSWMHFGMAVVLVGLAMLTL